MTKQVQEESGAEAFLQSVMEWSERLHQGGSLGQALDVSADECEALYEVGRGLYEQGRYADAFKVFSVLVVLDHMNDRHQMALGAACQALGRYEEAMRQYAVVGFMRLDDPLPVFHSAECMLHLGHLEDALESLGLAHRLADGNPAHQGLAARIESMQQLLRRYIESPLSQEEQGK